MQVGEIIGNTSLAQKHLYEYTLPDTINNTDSQNAYIVYDYLKIGDKCYKITDTTLALSDKILPDTFTPIITPVHNYAKDPYILLENTNTVFDIKNNKTIIIPLYYKPIGFVGSSNYLLITNANPANDSLLYLLDIKNGSRIIKLKKEWLPMNIVTKEKYTYILYSTESSAVKWTPTR